mgnify:FL=1
MIVSNCYKSKKHLKVYLSFRIFLTYISGMTEKKVAVIGALSTIGRAVLDSFAVRGFNADDIVALDVCPATEAQVPYGAGTLPLQGLDYLEHGMVQVTCLCLHSLLSEYSDRILRHSCHVIDCTGVLNDGMCVVADLNMDDYLKHPTHLISNPTSLTVTLSQVLAPLQDTFGIRSAEATALLSAGEFGGPTVDALANQTRSFYTHEPIGEGPFGKVQAFNLVPEMCPSLSHQTTEQIRSILGLSLMVSACLTPIFQGECYLLTVQTERKCTPAKLRKALPEQSMCRVPEKMAPALTITTLDAIAGGYIYLTHFAPVPGHEHTFRCWVLCDSFRTGSALNAVLVSENLLS